MPTQASKDLVILDNPACHREYEVEIISPEFTCLCPVTGQPDFATIYINYLPKEKIVELKSVKLYLWSFREEGQYHEAVINRMCDDLSQALQPHWLQIRGEFNVRGGITTNVTASYEAQSQRANESA